MEKTWNCGKGVSVKNKNKKLIITYLAASNIFKRVREGVDRLWRRPGTVERGLV
jgi:hypothetical protein